MKGKRLQKFGIWLLVLGVSALAVFVFSNKNFEASAAWWNDSWQYRKKITINKNKVIGNHENFPVLISIVDGAFVGKTQDDADDFVFANYNNTEILKHEIEYYNSDIGELVAWVKIPSLISTRDTDIYLYYGNTSISDQSDASSVWDAGYKAVHHMNDYTTATTTDSTANSFDGTKLGVNEPVEADGKIGKAQDFDGSDDYVALPSNIDVAEQPDLTFSAWVKGPALSASYYAVFNETQDPSNFLRVYRDTWTRGIRVYRGYDGSSITVVGDDVDDGEWHYITYTADNFGSHKMYTDGVLSDSNGDVLGAFSSSVADIGRMYFNSSYRPYPDPIDEVRISTVVRSPEWIKTEYNNQSDPGSFLSVSEKEEERPGNPIGYWSFDEGYGITAHDGSANKNNGTVSGAVWKGEEECVSGKCLYFDGTNDYINLGNSTSLDDGYPITIDFWIKTADALQDYSRILQSTSNYSNQFAVTTMTSGKLHFGYDDTPASTKLTNFVLTANKWQHVSLVIESNMSNAKCYLNGQEGSIQTGSGINFSTGDTYIGSRNGTISYFEGYLDEVKIYPYARSADQIKQDYNAGLSGVSAKSGVSTSFGSASKKSLSDGLVGYWKMDETSTSTAGAIDSSGNGYTGTYNMNASTTAGKFGNSGIFDDGDDSITMGDVLGFDRTDSFSLFAWVKSNAAGQTIMGKMEPNGDLAGYDIYDAGSEWRVNIREDSAVNAIYVSGQSDISDGTWHHVGFTYDGSSKASGVKLYVDGVDDTGAVTYDNLTASILNNDEFTIGGRDSIVENYDGQIDEARVYNRELKPKEVKKLYQWAPGPVAHWKFNEKNGSTAYDSVASSSVQGGNDSTISGATWTRGKFGSALSFDGSNDQATNVGFSVGEKESFTVSVWAKEDENSREGLKGLVSSVDYSGWDMTDSGWSISVGGGGGAHRLNVYAGDGVSGGHKLVEEDVFGDYKWHHISFVFDRNDGYTHTYIDGIEDASGRWDISAYGDVSGNRFSIGEYHYWYGGLIDDVRVYNYARTQKQILEDMTNGQANKAPVLHLSFDKGSGETVHDSSVHKNHGTAYVGTGGTQTATSSMWGKSGKIKGAMEFDGVDDYVRVDDNNVLDISEEISISVWVNPQEINYNTGVAVNNIVSKGNSYMLRLLDIAGIYGFSFLIYDESGGHNAVGNSISDLPATNTLYHLVGTYDGSTVKLYEDGVLKQTKLHSGDIDTNNNDLFIGAKDDFTSMTFFDGLIDEVKIWNYALSDDEIFEEYNSGAAFVMGEAKTANDNGTTVTGASTKYCIPGDTATCSPPVLELKMNERSGSTAYDSSGQGNDGTINGAIWARGKKGSGLEFDGSNDNLSFGDILDDQIGSAFTINTWIKISYGQMPTGEPKYIFWKNDDSPGIRINSSGNVVFAHQPSGVSATFDSNITVNEKQWYYISYVFDGSTFTGYIDGVYDNSISDSGYAVGGSVYIGHDPVGSRNFGGLIDDFKIYNYARTPAQIAWDYNKGKPIAHWKFDECSGGTIHDSSGNGNHGTLNLGGTGTIATGTCASSSDSFWYNGRSGKIKKSGSFDGTNDYIELGDMTDLKQEHITVSAWIYPESWGNDGTIIRHDSNGWDLDINNGSEIRFFAFVSGVSNAVVDVSDYSLNSWIHVMGVSDGSYVRLYVNGEEKAKTAAGGVVTYSGDEFAIGAEVNGGVPVDEFDGKIDDVRIYNYPLTAEQVKNVYNNGAVSFN